MSYNSANKRIAKNSIFLGIRMTIVLVIGLYSSRVILEVIGIEDYGIYNIVAGFVTMLSFINTSLSNGTQRFYNFELGKNGIKGANKVYNTTVIIQIILAIAIVTLTEIIGLWYLNNKMIIPPDRIYAARWIFQLALISLVLHIIEVPYSAAIMAHEKMNFFAIVGILKPVLTLAGIFAIKHISGDRLIAYGILITCVAFLSFLLNYIYCKNKFEEIYFSKCIEKKMFLEMLSFSGWNMFGTFGSMIKDQGINLALNLFFGPAINAARGIANQVNGGLQNFVSTLTIPVRPQTIQSYSSGDKERALYLTYTISKLSCFALMIMSIPIITEIDIILTIWLGTNIPEFTNIFIIIIIGNSFLLNLNAALSTLVHASGKMSSYQLSGFIISTLTVIVAYIVLKITKISYYALFTVLIMDCIRQLISVIIIKHIEPHFSYRKYLSNVIIPISAIFLLNIIIPLLIRINFSESIHRLILTFVVSTPTSLALTYFFGLDANEKSFIKNIFKSKIRKSS